MVDALLRNYAFNLTYAKMLYEGISADQMCQPAGKLVNHPAWTAGHLVQASEVAAMLLGGQPSLPEDWAARFGRGSTPQPDAAAYPSKDELLGLLERQHERVSDALRRASPDVLSQPNPNEEFRTIMPTVGDAVTYLVTSHEATHLGQLCAWRRAMGLPSVM